MDVRDGRTELDGVCSLFGLGRAAAERLCTDRRVEVAVEDGEAVGAVSYDARDGAVHVTRLAGDTETQVRLLDSPLRFASNEGVPVEMVVPEGERDTASALRAAGFEQSGSGPDFEGKRTTRYRHYSDSS